MGGQGKKKRKTSHWDPTIHMGTYRKEGGDQENSDVMPSVFLWEIFSIS